MQQKRQHRRLCFRRSPASRTVVFRAEDEAQTRDPQLGRLMLYQLSYFRKNIPYRSPPPPSRQPFGRPGGLRNSNRFLKWEVMDSNHRRRKPADLQSAPFDRSGNFPYFPPQRGGRCSAESDIPRTSGISNPAPSSFRRIAGLFIPGPFLSHRLSEPMEGFEPPTS